MRFKKLQFSDNNAQKVYENYLQQIESATKVLSQADRNDVLAEMNSHIYENLSASNQKNSEISNLVGTLERLGVPSEVLKPLIAEKKLKQAT
ncbi:MAG: HAAS signaling domain-containing protein, partial [Sphingobacterium sp.]